MPMQIHSGDGEAPGVILRRQRPYNLEEVARFDKDGVMRTPKIIPIHAGFPLVGEAAWLSHLYTNCYFEISLMNPTIHQGLERRFGAILEAVPMSKILFGSVSWSVPEYNWLAGRWGKRYLSRALAVHVKEDSLTRNRPKFRRGRNFEAVPAISPASSARVAVAGISVSATGGLRAAKDAAERVFRFGARLGRCRSVGHGATRAAGYGFCWTSFREVVKLDPNSLEG
jgi:hypothetical protein